MSTAFKGLTITVGADTKQFNKEMKAVDRSIRGTKRQVNELQKGLELEFDAGRFSEAQRLAQKAISETEVKAKALKEQLKYLDDNGADKTASSYQKLKTELVKTENQAVLLKNKLEEIKQMKIDKLAKQFEDVGGGITKAGQALAPFSAAAAGVLAGLGAMFKNTKDTAATIDDMRQEVNLSAEALQKWQYIAAQQGLDQTTLQNSLIKTQQAFSKLVVDGTGPGAEALMALGFTAEEAALGMDANFEVMIGRLAGVTDATQQAYLANEIFGNRMGAMILPMLNGGAEGLRELTAEFEALGYMTNEQITALAEFDDELLRIKTALGAIKDQVSVALIPVMETLADFISAKVIPAVRSLSEWFTGLSDGQKNALLGTLAFVAALAPALIIIGKMTTGMGGLIKAVGGIGKALSALMANPIIAVIALVAALLVLLYTKNEQFRESINSLVSTIGTALMPILEVIGDLFNTLLTAIMPLLDIIAQLLIPIVDALSKALTPLIEMLADVLVPIINAISPILEKVIGIITKIASVILKILVPVINKLGGLFAAVFGAIPGIIQGILGFIEKVVNSVINFINGIIRQINKLGAVLGFTIKELDNVSLNANITKEDNSKSEGGTETTPPGATDAISNTPTSPPPTSITNNDYSNKNIAIEVVVQNYAEEVDVDNLVEQINIKLAEQM